MPPVRQPRQILQGFSLIEVLVAMMILSIGVIGALKLQLSSMQATREASLADTATHLAFELADRVHGNHDRLSQARANPFLSINFQANEDTLDTSHACFSDNCTPGQSANADVAEWLNKISTQLPNARATVCLDDTPWNQPSRGFTWDCTTTGVRPSMMIKIGWQTSADNLAGPGPRIAIAVTPDPD